MSPAAPARLLPSCLALVLASIGAGCWDPPELEPLPPPPLDLGGLDTWEPLDLPDPGPDSAGPGQTSDSTGPEAGDENEGGAEPAPSDPALFDLRLTEVLADPEGKDGALDGPEYVEFLNVGDSPVNLEGLRVVTDGWPVLSGSELGLAGVALEPGRLLVIRRWTKDEDPELTSVELNDGNVWSGFLHADGLRNAEGFVALTTQSSDPIDGMVYGSITEGLEFDWLGTAVALPQSGHALCRLDPEVDTDGPGDWSSCLPSPASLGSAGALPPEPISPGALVVVEVCANPMGPSSEEKLFEYIELLNTSEQELELGNLRVSDATSLDVPGLDPLSHLAGEGGCESQTCLAPGRRALIVGEGYIGPTGDALILTVDDSTIADGGLTNTEPVSIWSSVDELLTGYRHWPDPSGEPLPPDGLSLHRIEASAVDEPDAWIIAAPSPGT